MALFIDAPQAERCTAVINLRDGTTAACGRRGSGTPRRCWQHVQTDSNVALREAASTARDVGVPARARRDPLSVICPKCAAYVGDPCHSMANSGWRKVRPHAERAARAKENREASVVPCADRSSEGAVRASQ